MKISPRKGRGVLDRGWYPADTPVARQYGTPTRQLTINVPANIPDHMVQTMWEIGQNAVRMLNLGAAVLLFPTARQGEDGQQIPSIGQQDILIQSPRDLELIGRLAKQITDVNVQIAQAKQQGPAQQVEATVRGTKAKANAARVAEGELNGTGGIIVPG